MKISRSILKWMLLGLGLCALTPLVKGQQDTLHLFVSDTTIYRGSDWNKSFSLTISAQAPYSSTVQFSFMWRPVFYEWPLSNAYDFNLEKIVPLDTPNVDLSHFGTWDVNNHILRVITHITPAEDGKPKALFKLFFRARQPDSLQKAITPKLPPFYDQLLLFPDFSNTPIEIVAVGPELKRPVILCHSQALMLRQAFWAGDVDNNGIVNQYDMLALGLEIQREIGIKRIDPSIEWKPLRVGNGVSNTSNWTKVYWDTNGDGLIDLNDTLAIHLNWGKTVPNRKVQPRIVRDTFSLPLSLSLDTLRNRQELEIPVFLGSSEAQVQNAYGLTFSINYGSGIGKTAQINTDFSKSFFKRDKRPVLTYVRNDTLENKLHVVVSRLFKRPVSGYGEIARVKLTVEDLIFIEPFLKNVNIDPQSIMMIDQDNNPIPVAPSSGEIRIISDNKGLVQNPLDQKLNIYPTPCKDVLHVQYDDLNIQNISIFSQDGKLIQQFQAFNQGEIDTSKLPNGVYQLHIESAEGKGVKKFLVQH